MIQKSHKLALFMERAFEENTGKMGLGVLRYSENSIVCLVDSASADTYPRALQEVGRQVPIVANVEAAAGLGADVLVLGTAPPGGLVPATWYAALDRAVELGMSLVNGLHDLLQPRYSNLRQGQFVWDVRVEPKGIGVGTGKARNLSNRRVLMIGTDMSVGKMTAGLEIARSLRHTFPKTSFVATGQTGIVITGAGVPLDAVRLDYASGAVESEVCKYESSDFIVIEGQGSLIHPGSSANLPLLRGSCPTHMILCHRAGMECLPKLEWISVPPILEVAGLYESLGSACGVFPAPRVVGVCLNTGHLSLDEANDAIRETEQETGLPVCDPVRGVSESLLKALTD